MGVKGACLDAIGITGMQSCNVNMQAEYFNKVNKLARYISGLTDTFTSAILTSSAISILTNVSSAVLSLQSLKCDAGACVKCTSEKARGHSFGTHTQSKPDVSSTPGVLGKTQYWLA